jgi:pantoate--beta-alanine ligase
MRTVHAIADVRAASREARAAGRTVGLVPTMGAFHAGHEALMRAARADSDLVVVSLFVNPTQFDDPADLAAYPRTEEADAATAARLGVDILWAPSAQEMYPEGSSTQVTVGSLGSVLEGASRGPGHFAGVCTVVAKLFNAVEPDVAYFGQKDAQQVAVLRRMARDLDFATRIAVVPTVREPDGLALSSRNVRLDGDDRARALALSQALRAAEDAAHSGERDAERLRAAALAALAPHGVEPDYLALVHPDTFEPVTTVNGRVLVAVAARVGPVRLIDNTLIDLTAKVATR